MDVKYFETSDFQLGSTLLSLGYKFEALDSADLSRLKFCFIRDDGLDEAVQAFWRGDIRVEPKIFCYSQKIIRNRMKNL
jgi:hypothetical protein